MATRYLEVLLRGYRGIDHVVDSDEFFLPLRASAKDERIRLEESEHPGEAARVIFVTVVTSDQPSAERSLIELVEVRLEAAAAWLYERVAEIEHVRAAGLNIDIYCDLGIENNSFSLNLPRAFVAACGRAGLPITLGGLDHERATQ